jgi:hypothetical protein
MHTLREASYRKSLRIDDRLRSSPLLLSSFSSFFRETLSSDVIDVLVEIPQGSDLFWRAIRCTGQLFVLSVIVFVDYWMTKGSADRWDDPGEQGFRHIGGGLDRSRI